MDILQFSHHVQSLSELLGYFHFCAITNKAGNVKFIIDSSRLVCYCFSQLSNLRILALTKQTNWLLKGANPSWPQPSTTSHKAWTTWPYPTWLACHDRQTSLTSVVSMDGNWSGFCTLSQSNKSGISLQDPQGIPGRSPVEWPLLPWCRTRPSSPHVLTWEVHRVLG